MSRSLYMPTLKEILPKSKSSAGSYYDHSNDPWFKSRYSASIDGNRSELLKAKQIPRYLKRAYFKPSKTQDFEAYFEDGKVVRVRVYGGAFPEILYAQYPLGMGRGTKQKTGGRTIKLMVDEHRNLMYDAIVKQNENSKKIVYSKHTDLVPIFVKGSEKEDEMDVDERQKEIDETTQDTKSAIEKIVNIRLSAVQPKNVPKQSSDSKFINYNPSQLSVAFNSGAKERIVRMVEMPVDPMEPPKFKHKRVPKASGCPPVPVMHSPPRPVTVKDQQDWNIPPSISNWKNQKGYTIPLDKRLEADGRGLQEVQINDKHAHFSEALHVSEHAAREAVSMRTKVQKEVMMKENEMKEMELRELARKAMSERTGVAPAVPLPSVRLVVADDDMVADYENVRTAPKETREERAKRQERDKIREERHAERKRERTLQAKDATMGKKSKITRDKDRDISENVALGMASTGGEVIYDQRLFNQEKGMDTGFATDDVHNIYDKGLLTSQSTLSTEKSAPRDRLVEFEKEEDPFGLNEFMTEVKSGKKAM